MTALIYMVMAAGIALTSGHDCTPTLIDVVAGTCGPAVEPGYAAIPGAGQDPLAAVSSQD